MLLRKVKTNQENNRGKCKLDFNTNLGVHTEIKRAQGQSCIC